MIKNFYDLLFYHFYKSFIQVEERNVPVFSAVLVFSFIMFMNTLTFFIIIDLLGINMAGYLSGFQDNMVPLILGGVILGLNYFYITSGNRHKHIIAEYSKRPLEQRKKGARITLIYALVSIALVFILAPLRVM